MPLRLLLDENLRDRRLWSAIVQHDAETRDQMLDVVRVGDTGGPGLGIDDAQLIAWAATENRILVGLDKSSLPRHLRDYCAAGNQSPGIVFLRTDLSINEVVELLTLITHVSESDEWANTYRWIP